jgi:hypothetical protein
MRHRFLILTLLAGALTGLAGPAHATAPAQDTITQHRVLQDSGENCGFPVRWTIDLVAERQRFYDQDGHLVRTQLHVHEDNTVINLDTGLTLREGPDSFLQTTYHDADGRVTEIVATGIAVNILQGHLQDVGRVVLIPDGQGGVDIEFSAGPHPVREAQTGSLITALKAFCGVLAG